MFYTSKCITYLFLVFLFDNLSQLDQNFQYNYEQIYQFYHFPSQTSLQNPENVYIDYYYYKLIYYLKNNLLYCDLLDFDVFQQFLNYPIQQQTYLGDQTVHQIFHQNQQHNLIITKMLQMYNFHIIS